MLKIEYRNGVFSPVVDCDHCSERIETAADGNYQWWMAGPGEDSAPAAIFFTHKSCCHVFEQVRRLSEDGTWGSEELSRLPVYLVNGLKVNWRKSQASARIMGSL